MPRLLLAAIFLLALFVVLCGPVFAVALRFKRAGDRGVMRPLPRVWLAQIVIAGSLVFAADAGGLANPGGWMAAVFAGVSLAGAAVFAAWRLARRRFTG